MNEKLRTTKYNNGDFVPTLSIKYSLQLELLYGEKSALDLSFLNQLMGLSLCTAQVHQVLIHTSINV